jgi:hypothetical protein
MAYFDLCVNQRKHPVDHPGIMKALRELQTSLYVSAGAIAAEPRQKNVDKTKGLIQKFFEDAKPPVLAKGAGTTIQLENAIRRSKIETAAFECKQGLLTLDDKRAIQDGLLEKIVQTLCGIANIGPSAAAGPYAGALFIGVADSEQDKKRIEQLDGVKAKTIGSRYCVGVDRELGHLRLDLDKYKHKIVSYIAHSGLTQDLKAAVLANIDCVNYRGFSVMALWVPPQRTVSAVDDVVFVREGSSTKRVDGFARTQAVIARFA